MNTVIECVALRTVRYSDRNSILTAYSRQYGPVSLLVPAGNGRQASRMRALMMPLGHFECVADIRPGREIYPVHDLRPLSLPSAGDPLRASLSLFIADVLTGLLREQSPDEHLFNFLVDMLSMMRIGTDTPVLTVRQLCNLHVWFLVRMSHYLGIEPDWHTYTPGSVLDMQDGIFRHFPPAHRNFLPPDESAAANRLSRMTPRNLGRYRFSRFERNTALDRILRYYHIHFPTFSEPSSLAVLRLMAD